MLERLEEVGGLTVWSSRRLVLWARGSAGCYLKVLKGSERFDTL